MSASSFITVHVRVNDAATGKPTPVRLRIAGPNGEYFAPFGRVAEFSLGRNEDVGGNVFLGGKRCTYIDGTCEIRLPTGVPLEVEITKGPEYEPVRKAVTLGPGQMALRMEIARWINLRDEGWSSEDTRCHFLTPHAALLEAAAEDVARVQLLACEYDLPPQDGHLYRTIPNITAFSGQQPALVISEEPAAQAREDADPVLAPRAPEELHQVIINTFNTHPALGRLALLNCHRPVYPLSFGGDASDDWSLCDWAHQCHRKKGTVVWCDAYRPEAGLPGGEALVAAVLGKVDGIEIDARERKQPFLPLWHRLLDAGVRLPLFGGSGKDSNRVALGSMRTYTASGHDFTYATNGPLLDFRVNGERPKREMEMSGGAMRLPIRATARSCTPFEKLEMVANGEVVAEAVSRGTPFEAEAHVELVLPEGGWVAARCTGSTRSELYPGQSVFAHTSPVFLRAQGKTPRVVPEAVLSLRREVEDVRHWVETVGRFEQARSKLHLLQLCDDALRVLAERLTGA